VAYSDEDGATAKSQLPDDDSSVTEKPSELGDSDSEVKYKVNIVWSTKCQINST